MANDIKNVMAFCKECGHRFQLGTTVPVKYQMPYRDKGGKSIFLTYYDCPQCGTTHYVQIDDTHTLELKKETVRMFARLSKKRMDFKQIPKKQNDKFVKTNNKLTVTRQELMKQFDGQVVFDADTGAEVELHFTIV